MLAYEQKLRKKDLQSESNSRLAIIKKKAKERLAVSIELKHAQPPSRVLINYTIPLLTEQRQIGLSSFSECVITICVKKENQSKSEICSCMEDREWIEVNGHVIE